MDIHIPHLGWLHNFGWVNPNTGHVVWWATGVSVGVAAAILIFMLCWAHNACDKGHSGWAVFLRLLGLLLAAVGYVLWPLAVALVVIAVVITLGIGMLGGAAKQYSAGNLTPPADRMNFRQDVRSGVDQALRDQERRESGWFG
jgi:hypothetical protein